MGGIVFGVAGVAAESFSPYGDDKGNISIPKDFRRWYFLGTWGIATDEEGKVGSQGFHDVYTQPVSYETMSFPSVQSLSRLLKFHVEIFLEHDRPVAQHIFGREDECHPLP